MQKFEENSHILALKEKHKQ